MMDPWQINRFLGPGIGTVMLSLNARHSSADLVWLCADARKYCHNGGTAFAHTTAVTRSATRRLPGTPTRARAD